MKQKMKKVVAAVLAAVMVLAMSVTAFAAETLPEVNPDLGSITIKGTETAPIAGREFKAIKLFDASVSADGNQIVYHANANTGKLVDAIKLIDKNVTDADKALEWLKNKDTNATAENMKSISSNLKIADVAGSGAYDKEHQKIYNLDAGYYAVYETTPGKVGEAVSLTMLDTLKNVATAKDIEVTLKAEAPTVEKKVNNADEVAQEIGKEVTYTITAKLPSTDTLKQYSKYEFTVTDKMSDGLELVGGKNGVTVKTIEGDSVGTAVVNVEGKTITVKMNDENDIKSLDNWENITGFVISYNAKVTDGATIEGNGNDNTVKITYTNNPQTLATGDSVQDKVKVYTYALDIKKVEKDNHKKVLKDAMFTLKDENGNLVKFSEADGVFKVDPNGKAATTDTEGKEHGILVSNSKGMINIEGLTAGKYTLEETDAPKGYNKLQGTVVINISDANLNGNDLEDGVAKTVTLETDNGKQEGNTVIIENSTGTVLPTTGGVGTTILYVVGILAMAAAVFYFVMNKRSKEVK